jgi:hypothetical protein
MQSLTNLKVREGWPCELYTDDPERSRLGCRVFTTLGKQAWVRSTDLYEYTINIRNVRTNFYYDPIVVSLLYLSMALQPPLSDLGRFFSVSWSFYTVCRTHGRGISPSQGRYLHIGQHKHRTNAHTSMPQVGFEPTIPVFERAKTVHALDRAATVIGSRCYGYCKTCDIRVLIVTIPLPSFYYCCSIIVSTFQLLLQSIFREHDLIIVVISLLMPILRRK